MGLQERQALAALKNDYMPEKLTELKSVTGGAEIEVTYDEGSLISVDAIRYIPDSIFTRLNGDVEQICQDQLGKDAIHESIKEINLIYSTEGNFQLDLTNGVLTIKGKFDGSLGSEVPGHGDYKEFLMKIL